MSEYIATEFDLASTEFISEYEEIVRCRDCKRWADDNCDWNRFRDDPECDEPDGFCAWGERRQA